MGNTNIKSKTMNDYWNDPPDYPDLPECCGDIMDVTDDGACVCPSCGKRIEPQPDIEPVETVEIQEDPTNRLTRRGY
jgi:hypothetical protein